LLTGSSLAASGTCTWRSPAVIGQLDTSFIDEASGLSASNLVPDRLYHLNDSGSEAVFYLTDKRGENLQTVKIAGFDSEAADLEDSDTGPCDNTSCLFLGDIGDNNRERSFIQVIAIEELASFPSEVQARHFLKLRYPDGPHNAEAFAADNEGNLYILSKEKTSLAGTAPARLYRLEYQAWASQPESVHVLELVALIDLRAFSSSSVDVFSHVATAMDISPDGQYWLILTYGNAFEFQLDPKTLPATKPLKLGAETAVELISLERLAQQESLTYLDETHFIYGTEARNAASPLMELSCTGSD
jgi:hypothetical protein